MNSFTGPHDEFVKWKGSENKLKKYKSEGIVRFVKMSNLGKNSHGRSCEEGS